jgi:transketolase
MTSQDLSRQSGKKIIQLAHANKASHVGGALSVVDMLSVLYSNVLKYKTKNPDWEDRDRFFYSKGHACTALYAILQEVGFYDEQALNSFTQNGSYFTSHVNHKVPGIELSTGSLGHALSVACGVALAGKRKKTNWQVYTILSDGELNEGSNWEALLFAPHHKLNNLTVVIDYNKIQSFGKVSEVLNLEPLHEKMTSFGWEVYEVDGHNHEQLLDSFLIKNEKPKCIIAHTIKGNGVPFMENDLAWHYKSPNDLELQTALEYLENRNK